MLSGIDTRRRWMLGAAVVAVGVMASGCPRDPVAQEPGPRQMVRVESFSEASPVRLLMAAPPYVFSATSSGLERWQPSTGQVLQLDAEHGLPGDGVEALAYDPRRGWLWVATDGGVTRYEVEQGTFVEVGPPAILEIESFAGVSMTPAGDGGVWVGHERGLFYVNAAGQWTTTRVGEPVRQVLRTRDGWLWVAVEAGLIGRRPGGEPGAPGPPGEPGEVVRFDRDRGCDLAQVRFMAEAPGGTPLIVGDNAAGEQRVVLIINDACMSYRASPGERWRAAARRLDELVVLTDERLYGVRVSLSGARSLSREGMRLLPVRVGPDDSLRRSPYVIRSLDVALPARPRALEVFGDEALIGTRWLGIARIPLDEGGEPGWLRRNELVRDAALLTVACSAREDCFVATGGHQAWRYDGAGFAREDVDGLPVLAFVRSAGGDIYALARSVDETRIVAYRRVDGRWSQVSGLEIEAAGRKLYLRCARFAPGGLLWLGLAYGNDDGGLRSHGVAVVDIDLGVVAYHRASHRAEDARQGVLPIPVGVEDVAFLDDEVWLATSEGAARVRGQAIWVFTEADGLRSELFRGVAVSPGGIVFGASGRGVQAYDGESWSYPKPLRWPVNDVDMGADGRLWMATDRGVAVFDGARIRRVDERRGLLQNRIDELRVDHLGRIWARGSQGLAIIAP